MRGSVLVLVSVLAVAAAGCSPRGKAPPTPPNPPAASAPPPAAAAQEGPPAAAAPEGPPAPSALPEGPPAPEGPPRPPKDVVVRFSPGDYGARERKLAALIANAESRDTLGDTQRIAAEGRRQRERCASRACIERSYAAEEAKLRQWEGSGDVR